MCENLSFLLESFITDVIKQTEVFQETLDDTRENEISNLRNFLETLGKIVQTISHQCTVLCLMFTSASLPSSQELTKQLQSLSETINLLFCTFSSLSNQHGRILLSSYCTWLNDLIKCLTNFINVIKEKSQFGCENYKQSTGNIWEQCDHFKLLPKDNKEAVLEKFRKTFNLIQDAILEIEEAVKSEEEEASEDLDEIFTEHWTENDRVKAVPFIGLIKCPRSLCKRVILSIKQNSQIQTKQQIAELDQACEISERLSPAVDELVTGLHPPMINETLKKYVEELITITRLLLEYCKSAHFICEDDEQWVKYLESAITHNEEKIYSVLSST